MSSERLRLALMRRSRKPSQANTLIAALVTGLLCQQAVLSVNKGRNAWEDGRIHVGNGLAVVKIKLHQRA
jgi:hypothetical protein